jgi:hypothetical protein
MAPDSHPFLDVHPIHKNVVIGAGFSGRDEIKFKKYKKFKLQKVLIK